ncbi:unnamed protein product [Ectocarpus sp. CCAP 1310/34]|nr:unnamed protein product [Ectocarpus sp. CCAP 1310/34]
MVRTKGNVVLSAVRDQIDCLKRSSRQNAWGIQASLQEPVTGGFAQSEDIVVSVFIPYCESGAEWEVVIDGDAPERSPDLVPFPSTEGDVNRGFTQGMHEAYNTYRLASLDSLKKWDLFRRPSSLAALALDIKQLRRKHEIQKLENSPLASAMSFHLDYLRDRQEDVELLVSRAGVRLAFPLWPDPTTAAATASTAAQAGAEAVEGEGGGVDVEGEGPMFVYGRAGVRLRMEWTQVDGKRPPDVRVLFPQEAQGLTMGFRQPPWTSETKLGDYLSEAQAAVVKPWSERKNLVAMLAKRYNVLEYDARDFTMLHLFMKVKVDNLIFLRILRVDIGPDFPNCPPQLTLCDSLSEKSWSLDRRDYRYSPRWDTARMATALYTHAVDSLSKLRD